VIPPSVLMGNKRLAIYGFSKNCENFVELEIQILPL